MKKTPLPGFVDGGRLITGADWQSSTAANGDVVPCRICGSTEHDMATCKLVITAGSTTAHTSAARTPPQTPPRGLNGKTTRSRALTGTEEATASLQELMISAEDRMEEDGGVPLAESRRRDLMEFRQLYSPQ